MTLSYQDAMSRAKIQLMNRENSTFFTTVVFSLELVWSKAHPTAATNGRQLFMNEDHWLTMGEGERVTTLVHEGMHVAYDHMGRRNDRDMERWNIACDLAINLQLRDAGYDMQTKDDWLLEEKYAGMSAEEIYSLLPETMPKNKRPDILQPSGGAAEHQNHIKELLVRARIQSKMAGDKPGSVPGDIDLMLEGLLNPKLPWYVILQKFFKGFAKTDYTFKKPNRRHFPTHYLPSLHGHKVADLEVYVDISGSVSDIEFTRFVSELKFILKFMKPDKIKLVQFDTEIVSEDIVRNVNELMAVKFTGRGGTYIKPVLDMINKNKPQVALIFSDGGFHFEEDAHVDVPVVWLIHNNSSWTCEFGTVVHYETETN